VDPGGGRNRRALPSPKLPWTYDIFMPQTLKSHFIEMGPKQAKNDLYFNFSGQEI